MASNVVRLADERIDHFAANVLLLDEWTSEGFRPGLYKIDSPIGDISATTTFRVTVRGKGIEVAMTADEARKLARNLNHAASQVEKREMFARGDTTYRITLKHNVPHLSINQMEFTVRQQTTRSLKRRRRYQSCSRCGKRFSDGEKHWSSHAIKDSGWGNNHRSGEQRLCLACFDACVVDGTPRVERIK